MSKIIKIKACIKLKSYMCILFFYTLYHDVYLYFINLYTCANKTKSQYKFYSFI